MRDREDILRCESNPSQQYLRRRRLRCAHQSKSQSRNRNTNTMGYVRCVRATTQPVAPCVSSVSEKSTIEPTIESIGQSGSKGEYLFQRARNSISIAKPVAIARKAISLWSRIAPQVPIQTAIHTCLQYQTTERPRVHSSRRSPLSAL